MPTLRAHLTASSPAPFESATSSLRGVPVPARIPSCAGRYLIRYYALVKGAREGHPVPPPPPSVAPAALGAKSRAPSPYHRGVSAPGLQRRPRRGGGGRSTRYGSRVVIVTVARVTRSDPDSFYDDKQCRRRHAGGRVRQPHDTLHLRASEEHSANDRRRDLGVERTSTVLSSFFSLRLTRPRLIFRRPAPPADLVVCRFSRARPPGDKGTWFDLRRCSFGIMVRVST